MPNLDELHPSDDAREKILNRLSRVEGQIRGVQRLVHERQNCEKILQQLSASRKALDKTFVEMISCLMEACLTQSVEKKENIELIRALLSKYG